MNIEQFKSTCCGCGSCMQACPRQAISMNPDENGFQYPTIDLNQCVSCGICVARCPMNGTPKVEAQEAYYGWNKDISVRMESSSGGVFSALADVVLRKNGVIFGAAFDPKTKKVIYDSTDRVNIDALRRSKYTESIVGTVYQEIQKELKTGRHVLFCGTPCHVAGLKSFLAREYDNLYTCDFVCGGNASPAFFVEHLRMLEKKYRAPVASINFRDKKMGWKRMLFHVRFQNGRSYRRLSFFDSYFNGFIEGIAKRENCFSCAFADNHLADITIADYWGYRAAGVAYDERGISMLVVNTAQGSLLLKEAEAHLDLTPMSLEGTKYTIRPRILDKNKLARRDQFFAQAKEVGFEKAAKQSYMKHPYLDVLLSYLHLK